MKKSLGVLMVIVLTVSLFGIVELNTIFGPEDLTYYLKRNQEFYDLTGIRVNITVVPYGRDQNAKLMASMLAGGSQYDVFVVDCVEVPRYAEAGWLLDLTDIIPESVRNDIIPFARDGMSYEGRLYGLPWYSEWKSFAYNKAMLNKVGYSEFPKTWDEVIELSQKLQEAEIVKYASAWSWAQKECLVCDFVSILYSFGGEFFDENQNPVFNNEAGIQAVQAMVDMVYKYKIVNPSSLMWTEPEVYQAMLNGDIAYSAMWGLPLVDLNNEEISNVVGECDLSLFPSVDGLHPYTCAGPMGWAVSYGTNYPEEAYQYIQFLSTAEGSLDAALVAGIMPGMESAWASSEFQASIPGIEKMHEQSQYVAHRPRVPWYLEWTNILQEELHKALTQLKSPKEALESAAEAAIKIKNEYQ